MVRLLFAAGGTGGHLRPAIATAEAVHGLCPAASILFLCSGRPVDDRFLAARGYGQEALFPGLVGAPARLAVGSWLRAFARARAVLRDFEPDAVVGFGGYPTGIAGLAAQGPLPLAVLRALIAKPPAVAPGTRPRRPPLVLLEQNAAVGLAVRLLGRSSSAILLALPDARSAVRGGGEVLVTGNPLPASMLGEVPVDPALFGLMAGRRTLLVLGGSQGARGVNRMVLEARSALARRHPDLQIVMLTGDLDLREASERVAAQPVPTTVVLPFETRMRELYQLADLVVARAGGTTLAELAVVGRAMILVPYPHHKDQHQLHNARAFERVGAARIVAEGDGAVERLLAEADRFLDDAATTQAAAAAARTLARPDAARGAAEVILREAGWRPA